MGVYALLILFISYIHMVHIDYSSGNSKISIVIVIIYSNSYSNSKCSIDIVYMYYINVYS